MDVNQESLWTNRTRRKRRTSMGRFAWQPSSFRESGILRGVYNTSSFTPLVTLIFQSSEGYLKDYFHHQIQNLLSAISKVQDLKPDIPNKRMAIQSVGAFLLVTVLPLCIAYPSIRDREEERIVCETCGNDCDKCKFGISFSSLCEVLQCRRGPGEICGGYDDKYGMCGDGLTCHCNKCVGCSTDLLECYTNSCLPHTEIQLSHPNHFNGLVLGK
ncbi:uncharacterized protein LOC117172290 [Belonocnema kinseyi]|uniref:uncharacterized protein LOC117172290 n=1 Tax=Belonocnema kinseyi TaxID=2817044 RepID=UPI00143CFA71|nr:uncharacterized protein LOC117172290 [Belonocnema kinseyi]